MDVDSWNSDISWKCYVMIVFCSDVVIVLCLNTIIVLCLNTVIVLGPDSVTYAYSDIGSDSVKTVILFSSNTVIVPSVNAGILLCVLTLWLERRNDVQYRAKLLVLHVGHVIKPSTMSYLTAFLRRAANYSALSGRMTREESCRNKCHSENGSSTVKTI